MLFMIQMQILHSFYQSFSPPLLATNAFHWFKNKYYNPFIKIFPPPSWQLMLFMIQMQILHSFYQSFHGSKTNITILLSNFSPPPLGN